RNAHSTLGFWRTGARNARPERPKRNASGRRSALFPAARRTRTGRIATISSSDNLNADSFRIYDMKPGIQVIFRSNPAGLQLPCHGFLVEILDSDREVIHQTGRIFVVQRDE